LLKVLLSSILDIAGTWSTILAQDMIQDFTGRDFSHTDLRGWDFTGAQLQSATFRNTNLLGACLREADARGAIFEGANLTEADFTGALVQGAYFRQATLWRTIFRQALLLSAHLEGALVREADFTGANLAWAWVTGVDFQQALVTCAVFLNVRGLTVENQQIIEAGGGFTGKRGMILGRELYETSPADASPPESEERC